ncbi:MAG TPA: SDR family NAD(P)-dependent oxidoreductase, partial [Blastocatellia bacterium]|nr:SDR family NAD(P)-dependent oxidoreductase [Blastocatellia bacterium]
MEALRIAGANVEYFPADVSKRDQVKEVIDEIKERHGGITGIIHAAGTIRDSYLVNKTSEEITDVLAAKVHGLLVIDDVTRGEPLEFLVLFSSISAIWGNAGQSDYAAANAFLDSFGASRNDLVKAGQRSGRTLSLNWPLWRSGGMKVDQQSEKLVERVFGFTSLSREAGLDSFMLAMRSSFDQVVVLSGDAGKLRETVMKVARPEGRDLTTPERGQPEQAIQISSRRDGLSSEVEKTLIQGVCQILKVDEQDLELDEELSVYGFDSISLTEFSNRLSGELKIDLLPTIFYEYPTLGTLKEFLLKDHAEALMKIFPAQTGQIAGGEDLSHGRSETGEEPVVKARESGAESAGPAGDDAGKDAIAIIGLSARFPKARDLDEFWNNLIDGRDCIELIPEERWDWRAIYGDPHREENKTNIKWGGFIEGLDLFDSLFFGISPKEAELIDPQHRLLMEHVWAAMEQAGYSARALSGTRTGMFLAIGPSGYGQSALLPIDGYTVTGTAPSMAPNRISYFLNLRGPSEPVETACSSSLVAIHRAVQAIDTGSCDQAFVGGVNTIISPEVHISFSKAGMLSEDGRCKTFSKQANGYARGEGVGVIFLKRLRQAQQDGDTIYGVINGTIVNHGGRATSLTAPSVNAQAELLRDVYRRAKIDVRTVTYIETHGTGTALGDPIEINALKKAFKSLYEDRQEVCSDRHCALGSVKTNIGHLEIAAGMAGVLKVLLAMKHRALPKTLHCEETNPYIELEGSPFYLLKESRPWPRIADRNGKTLPRRAGISSFGFGGANAHVIVEEYLAEAGEGSDFPSTPDDQRPVMVPLSARTEDRLKEYAGKLLSFLHGLEDSPSAGQSSPPLKGQVPGSLSGGMKAKLKEELLDVVAQTIAVDRSEIDLDDEFQEYGAEMSQIANSIYQALNVEVTARSLNEAGSIKGLIDHLFEKQLPALCAHYRVNYEEAAEEIRNIGNLSWREPVRLADVAYTLQVGRDAMEHRVLFLARHFGELKEIVQRYASGERGIQNCFQGRVSKDRDSIRLLNADEQAKDLTAKWMQYGKFTSLAEFWVRGLDLDWNALYGERRPRRVSLPTYPFARDRHWLPEVKPDRRVAQAPSPEPETALLRYVEEWRPQPDGELPIGNQPLQLIHFTEDEAQSEALAALLEGRRDQSRLIRVVKGARFRRLDSTHYEVPAEGEAGYRELWESLAAGEDRERAGEWATLYGWGEGLTKIRGLHSLLKTSARSSLELKRLIITGRAVDELSSCDELSLIGYERSLGISMPQLRVTVLYGDEAGMRAEQLWPSLWRTGVIRWQGGACYRLGYRAASNEDGAVGDAGPRLRKGGAYLITGGGGGLGEVFAEHLARTYQARIALVGRRDLDDRLRERLGRLKEQGAWEAVYYAADVGDRERMS